MNAVEFDVTIPGFVVARTLGKLSTSLLFGTAGTIRARTRKVPKRPGDEWVLLKVLGCGICGSDLGNVTYQASPLMEPFGSFPAVLGHEILAVVEEVGPRVERVAIGDRVAVDPMISCRVRGHSAEEACDSCRIGRHSTCEQAGEEGVIEIDGHLLRPGLTVGYHKDLPGGWGERMVAHDSQLIRLDPRLPSRKGVLIEPLSIGVHAALNAPPDPSHDVLVIGSGPIAFATIWALRSLGFEGAIVAQTKRPHEAALARSLGADDVVAPGNEARDALIRTGASAYQPIVGPEVYAGGGFPVIFDCVGTRSSLDQAMRFARARGTIVVLGCAAQISRLDLTSVWSRELSMRGFVGYGAEVWRGESLHTMEVTHRLLLENDAPIEELVSHVFPLSQYRSALSAAANHRRSEAIRVVLTPSESGLPAD